MRPAVAATALLLPLGASAFDPSLPWFTVETPSFRVHYHQGPGQHELAQRVARTCEAAHRVLVPLLGWAPSRKTEVLLTDDVDSANGSATAFLRPMIALLAEPPGDLSVLNDYEDHLWDLVTHEYAHVLHLDNARGVPALANAVFGKLYTPNAYVPRWLVEGVATYQESNVSSAGRNRSALFDMWLRAGVLFGLPFRLDEVTHYPTRWPRGNIAYLYGGRFLRYIAERIGEERLANFFSNYGSRLVPFALNVVAAQELGVDFATLFGDWQAALAERYRVQARDIEARGATRYSVLTRSGEETGNPRFSHDGTRIFYLEGGPDRRASIRSVAADGTGDRQELELWADAVFDLSPDDSRIALAFPSVWQEHSFYDDLYEADLSTKELKRLTHGLRATEPSYGPDGHRLAFVGRSGAGWSYLGLFDLRTHDVRRLVEAGPAEKLFTPAFADEKTLIFTQQSGRARILRRLDLDTGEVRTVIAGDFLVLQARPWQGGRVLVASDRSGVYNLYAVDLETGSMEPLTNVLLGAFLPAPSPDGSSIAFAAYSDRGYDVALMPLEARFRGELPARAERPDPAYRDEPRLAYPVREYETIEWMAPQYWLPLLGEDPAGPAAGAFTEAGDLTGRHHLALGASWGFASGEPSVHAGYGANVAYPSLSASFSTFLQQAAGFPRGVHDRVWTTHVSATFSRSLPEAFTSLSVGHDWRLLNPRPLANLLPDAPAPRIPARGAVSALQLSWVFSTVRRFAHSVSAEEGHLLALSVRRSGRETLASFDFTSFDARYQTYLALPWASHHAAALRLAAGAAVGDIGSRRVFSLGGIELNDPLVQLLRGDRSGPGHLRGYPPGAFAGNSFALASLEYRFPIVEVGRGVSSLPFFIRRLHGAAFADLGAVGDGGPELASPKPSLGAELRGELFFAYYAGTELRLGVARGLAERGEIDLYLSLGTSF
ncbi:MAG: PD40 domain-containing protein [Myxococcales bacterium]|nr:PD40 domain-containing protein [Myxococcales bacterium]